jgi:uncharacterized protein involved in exopolysaccharide biosynthesis
MIDSANKTTRRDVCKLLRRPIFLFCAIVMTGLLLIILAPRRYHSSAKIFVRLGRESVGLDPTATAVKKQSTVSLSTQRESEIRSIVEMIQNRELYERVVTALSPEVILGWKEYTSDGPEHVVDERRTTARDHAHWIRSPGKRLGQIVGQTLRSVSSAIGFNENDVFNEAVDELGETISISSSRRSTVIEIAYRSPQPELSQAVVATLVDSFLEMHPKWNRVQNSTTFFADQVALADKQLNSAHAAFAAKKNEINVASLETYPDELAKQLSALDVERMSAQRHLASERMRMNSLQSEINSVDRQVVTEIQSGIPDAGRDAMRSRLYDLELEEREMAARYRDNYVPLIAVRQQITSAREVLQNARDERSNTTRGLNPIRTQAETALALQIPEVAAAEARAEKLESQYAELTHRIRSFNEDEIELASLKREVDLAESNFRAYAASWEEARVDHALQNSLISNVNVVQPATLQPEAVFPKELPSLLCFGLFGLVASGTLLWYDLRRNAAVSLPGQIAANRSSSMPVRPAPTSP